jgi:hypothetical protein
VEKRLIGRTKYSLSNEKIDDAGHIWQAGCNRMKIGNFENFMTKIISHRKVVMNIKLEQL